VAAALGVTAPRALSEARRPLVLGIGGGGDVVGALATAEHCRLEFGARPVLGGVSWERRAIDPQPGPRSAREIEAARPLGPAVLAATGATRARGSGVRFAEARMAELLGEETVLVDATRGPAEIAAGLCAAVAALGCDLAVFVDVGGDVLAQGGERGLASPLCDALLLAAAVRLGAGGTRVLGGVVGIGCDGELDPDEVLALLARLDRADGLRGRIAIGPSVAAALQRAVAAIPTEASALALRAFHGESGEVEIRGGRRRVDLRPGAAETWYYDPEIAFTSVARLACAVSDARDLDHANDLLHALGVRTELDYERDQPHTS
jgi:hypothetical protein